MKFRYLGDKNPMKAFGHDFSAGKTPNVTDKQAIAKLQGNSHFEALDDPKRPTIPEMLRQIQEATNLDTLTALAEGEDREKVLEAISKKQAEFQTQGGGNGGNDSLFTGAGTAS